MAVRFAGGALIGLLLGFLGSHLLVLGWLTLIPWGLAALAVGAVCRGPREAGIAGAAYGFVLGFSFTAFGYQGADPIVSKLPFFAALGLFSAVFGMAGGLIGQRLIARHRASP
jgi:hypothetical protein